MDQKSGTLKNFRWLLWILKFMASICAWRNVTFFFGFRCHFSFQFNTWGHASMSHCSTKLPDWHKLCDTMLVSGMEMREIYILVWNIWAIGSHSRPLILWFRGHISFSLQSWTGRRLIDWCVMLWSWSVHIYAKQVKNQVWHFHCPK